ncbi:MAG: hypothetical protein ABW178_07310, partial [Pseudoxanthomonas sp.]
MSALLKIERPARGPARGLVLLLHGVGADEQSLVALAQRLPDDVHVVLPRAPRPFGPAAYGWFQVAFTEQGPVIRPEQAEASRLQLIDFIADTQQRLGIAPAKTLVAGFSQGGIMSAGVALTSPGSVAGFGILSGRILPEIEPRIPQDIAMAQDVVAWVQQRLPAVHACVAGTRCRRR